MLPLPNRTNSYYLKYFDADQAREFEGHALEDTVRTPTKAVVDLRTMASASIVSKASRTMKVPEVLMAREAFATQFIGAV
jgi:hypothetical protein